MTDVATGLAGEQRVVEASTPGGAFLMGRWVGPGEQPVTDPEDGTTVGYVVTSTVDDVSAAIGHLAASSDRPWSLWERARTFRITAQRVADESEMFAELIAAEGIKTLGEARSEVARCVETLTLAASATDELLGSSLPFDASPRGTGKVGWYAREPLGVVAAITPFNDPLNLVAHKVAPALVAGNAVILKPSEQTPLTALALVEVLLGAGVPGDRIAVVCGGADVGQAVVSDPRIAAVSFTGGPRTALEITRSAGIKKLLMELGGNNPTIVCQDADLERASQAVLDGAFGAAGQNCLSVQRVYAHTRVFEQFRENLVARVGRLKVGSKRKPDSDVGPLVSESAARRIGSLVDSAVRDGAKVLVGGRRDRTFFEPTVLTDVPPEAQIQREEAFGPVVTLERFETHDDVVEAENKDGQALHAGVFTASLHTANWLSRALHAGCVLVNETSDFRIDAMPFGGFGDTGIGREGVRFAVRELSAPKSVVLAE